MLGRQGRHDFVPVPVKPLVEQAMEQIRMDQKTVARAVLGWLKEECVRQLAVSPTRWTLEGIGHRITTLDLDAAAEQFCRWIDQPDTKGDEPWKVG